MNSVAENIDTTAPSNWVAACLADQEHAPDCDRLIRKEAREAWTKLGFPTPALEDWKYTTVDRIVKGNYKTPRPVTEGKLTLADLGDDALPGMKPIRVVFVDGFFDSTLSNVAEATGGILIWKLGEFPKDSERFFGSTGAHRDHAFAALNTALFQDAVAINVDPGKSISRPILVLHVVTKEGSGMVYSPRLVIKAAANSSVTVIKSFIARGGKEYFTNSVTEIHAGEGAKVDLHRIQCESLDSAHITHTSLRKEKSASTQTHFYSFGSAIARNFVDESFSGEGGHGTINGLTVIGGTQHVDNSTVLDHAVPNCESSELFKGIYGGTAKGVFSGTIIVRKDAQKTNAYQSNQTLLLSNEATIDTRPQLKIWADDVKCTHGATIGQIDEKALRYLRARGIDKVTAKRFLIHAFASSLISQMKSEPLKEYVEGLITKKLEEIEAA